MRRVTGISALFVFALLTGPGHSQELAKEFEEKDVSRAMQWAADTGKVAGAANFCALDADAVEDYIAAAQAKIAAIANDKVDRVVARIEFGNVYNVAASQVPLEGCKNFALIFPQEVRKLN